MILSSALSLSFNKAIKVDLQSVLLPGDIRVSKRHHSVHTIAVYRKTGKILQKSHQKYIKVLKYEDLPKIITV